MKLSEFKTALDKVLQIEFILPNGEVVPSHVHVTEIGHLNKHFIDCGGIIREEQAINFQLFTSTDYDHKLEPEKLSSILEVSTRKLNLPDAEIEVEYQGRTVEKYGLEFDAGRFLLSSKMTDCLATDKCRVPEIETQSGAQIYACEPEAGCC